MTTNLEETISVVEDLIEAYSADEDILALQKIRKDINTIESNINKKQDNVTTILKELTTDVQKLEENINNNKIDQLQKKFSNLQDQQTILKEEEKLLSEKFSALKKNLNELDLEEVKVKTSSEEETKNLAESLPKFRYLISLYSHISHIEFNLESQNFKGHLHLTNSKNIIPFDFPLSASKYEISDFFWKQLNKDLI